ncbi:MAG: DNA topoisomerase [Lachnospiraceae bacterium]|nr:DNA topoisomerase [Lachnospiraceae bacterium]
MKSVYIAEKPSVAQEFAKALHENMNRKDGYLESEHSIVTWCVGHLVTMSYPEAYDPALKRWSLDTLPFLPNEWKYEVLPDVAKQFRIVKGVLTREDVDRIYVCTDSGREGEYIYRLVDQMAEVPDTKDKRRVWIDSQTEEEILRGIREAKPIKEYDSISDSAYLRAKEDYLMGINFSRLLTLKYGYALKDYLQSDRNVVIAVGRVMTCVLGMIVRRQREIRSFQKTPFYRVLANVSFLEQTFEAEWRAVEGSRYYQTPLLYGEKGNGFVKKETARELINFLSQEPPLTANVLKVEKKTEKKAPPMLYNLAELQNDCSKLFKISPDQTLSIVQELYEKKLVTYPRTDARVLSTAVAKEIHKNLRGLSQYAPVAAFASYILEKNAYHGLVKSKYVNDKQITDHYAIIPTGQGLGALNSVSDVAKKVYEIIARRFVSIFYPAAEYKKVAVELERKQEHFFSNFRVLDKEGYLKIAEHSYGRKKAGEESEDTIVAQRQLLEAVAKLKKGSSVDLAKLFVKEGETSPPKPYTSGSLILAMENAGKLIEDEELRSQIKGCGIGTSATRAEIIKKLTTKRYIALNRKSQVVSPTQLGELIYEVVDHSISSMLNPELTASWEKGLGMVAEGTVTPDEYMTKLDRYISDRTVRVKQLNNRYSLKTVFDQCAPFYKKKTTKKKK